jgi:hypothetical protein
VDGVAEVTKKNGTVVGLHRWRQPDRQPGRRRPVRSQPDSPHAGAHHARAARARGEGQPRGGPHRALRRAHAGNKVRLGTVSRAWPGSCSSC